MRGTGLIGINGATVYAYYTRETGTLRLRLSVDEADRLALAEGLRVQITLPGREAADVLVTAATSTPPYVWLQLELLAPRTANRAG